MSDLLLRATVVTALIALAVVWLAIRVADVRLSLPIKVGLALGASALVAVLFASLARAIISYTT